MLSCQTAVRPARVRATPALFPDTPWPSWESLYLHRGYSSCWFATVSPDGLMVEIRFMPEELRWSPGISRCCFAAQYVPVSPGGFKIFDTTRATSRFNAVLAGVATVWSRCRYGVVPVGPHRIDAGTKIRDSVNEAYGTVMVVLHIYNVFSSMLRLTFNENNNNNFKLQRCK